MSPATEQCWLGSPACPPPPPQTNLYSSGGAGAAPRAVRPACETAHSRRRPPIEEETSTPSRSWPPVGWWRSGWRGGGRSQHACALLLHTQAQGQAQGGQRQASRGSRGLRMQPTRTRPDVQHGVPRLVSHISTVVAVAAAAAGAASGGQAAVAGQARRRRARSRGRLLVSPVRRLACEQERGLMWRERGGEWVRGRQLSAGSRRARRTEQKQAVLEEAAAAPPWRTIFGVRVHRGRAQLHLHGHPSRAHHRRVEALVARRLRRGKSRAAGKPFSGGVRGL